MAAKWTSLPAHMFNIHHHDNHLYPSCVHGELQDEDRNKQWLKPNTQAGVKIEQIVLSKSLLTDIKKLSPAYQTSSLEGFHSLILKFAPKHTAFSNLGMPCRLHLAAMHFNENSDRMQAITKDGQPLFSSRFPKFKKGGYSVHATKTAATFKYTSTFLHSLFESCRRNPSEIRCSSSLIQAAVPPPLAMSMVHPEKEVAVAAHVSRFVKH